MAPRRRIYRGPDCEKYLKWKAERAQKFKKKKKEKKRKKKEPILDCVDEDEVKETEAKIKFNYRKCKGKRKKKKQKTPKRPYRKIYKHIPYGDLLISCIKPSLEEREFLLNPFHARCLGLDAAKLSFEPETPEPSEPQVVSRKKSVKMRFPCSKGKRKPKRYPKSLQDQKEDDSECDSICSFDSEICLTGVKLTQKDMEEIKKYQREAQKSQAKLEKK